MVSTDAPRQVRFLQVRTRSSADASSSSSTVKEALRDNDGDGAATRPKNLSLTLQMHSFNLDQTPCLCPRSTATPHPGGFKCFTCQDAADNYECNRWAPDVYCPKGNACSLCMKVTFPELHHLPLLLRHKFNWTSIFNDREMKVSYFPDTKYCYTLHVMGNSGESVSVTKRCVPLEDCLLTGCTELTENGYQVRSSSILIKPHPCP